MRRRAPATAPATAPAWAFLWPTLALLGVLLAAPVGYAFFMSFRDTTAATLAQGGDAFVGLDNYVTLLGDAEFRASVWLLLKFIAVTTALEVLLATAVAWWLDQVVRPWRIIETLLIVPMFVIPVVSGLTFRYLLDPSEGVSGLVWGWFGAEAPGFLGDADLAFWAIVLQDVWRMWPFVFLIIYAGFKSLPREPLEAVRLDGANAWQAFFHVILPMLRPTLLVAVLLKVVESLKAFTEIYVMTGGGPGEATSLLSMYVVKQAFTFFKVGYGSAVSILLLAVGVSLAVGVGLAQRRRERRASQLAGAAP